MVSHQYLVTVGTVGAPSSSLSLVRLVRVDIARAAVIAHSVAVIIAEGVEILDTKVVITIDRIRLGV
jgi:hypothetical protein